MVLALERNELAKLKIQPQPPSALEEITVLFNPNTYTVRKSVTWSTPPTSSSASGSTNTSTISQVNAPPLVFGGGGSRELALELFFDVTENPFLTDVRKETDKIVALTRIDKNLTPQRPPTCVVSWGEGTVTKDFPFIGVVKTLDQRFTLFTSKGIPVRATLTLSFVEFLDPKIDKRETDPELTTRVLKRGDSLSSIAAEVYRNPALWRVIAEANGLDDPLHLEIGRTLTIPKL